MALQRYSPSSKAWLAAAAVIHLRLSRCHLRTRPRPRRYLSQRQNQLVCLNPTLPSGDLLTLTSPSLHRQVFDSLVIPNLVTQDLPTENENIFLDTLCGLRSLPSLIISFSCIIKSPSHSRLSLRVSLCFHSDPSHLDLSSPTFYLCRHTSANLYLFCHHIHGNQHPLSHACLFWAG
jgi:hypothetical protein